MTNQSKINILSLINILSKLKNVSFLIFRYRGIDDDDECMESDFRTLQKEEYRSSRAGKIFISVLF